MGILSFVMLFIVAGEGFQMLLSVDGHCVEVECALERISEHWATIFFRFSSTESQLSTSE
jgi:hypothetical protein